MKSLRQQGFILADFLVTAGLLGLIITLLALAVGNFSKFNQCQWGRQQCLAAAQAQLDSITAGGALIETQELVRLWPQVTLSVDRSLASGPWAGLDLVQVTAVAGQAKVRLVRYLRPRTAVAKGGQS